MPRLGTRINPPKRRKLDPQTENCNSGPRTAANDSGKPSKAEKQSALLPLLNIHIQICSSSVFPLRRSAGGTEVVCVGSTGSVRRICSTRNCRSLPAAQAWKEGRDPQEAGARWERPQLPGPTGSCHVKRARARRGNAPQAGCGDGAHGRR